MDGRLGPRDHREHRHHRRRAGRDPHQLSPKAVREELMSAPLVDDIKQARERIRGFAHTSPTIVSFPLSRLLDADVRLKLECFQDTRAFKVRGAANAILTSRERGDVNHLVTYSTGNHGRATALVGARLGIPTSVVMSNMTTDDKRQALTDMGAELHLVGKSQDEAQAHAMELASRGMTLIDPINDPASTAGHGTIALEIIEQFPEVDTVVVPVSGGALASGVAIALKAERPETRVVAVSMDRGAAMYESLRAGKPVEVPEVESLADCLQGGIGLENDHTFATVRDLIDEFVLVTEQEIGVAMAEAYYVERLILEGAGATPIAAAIKGDRSIFGDHIALIATGGNTTTAKAAAVAEQHRRLLPERFQP
ncbi:MAG: pyridoxal-phosphate dependent enzyme [Actinobacteria bacterium]|nr:MAG: pyridoxal-phosphate dependent enzyme [Actinomycetota bacterium]